MKAIARISMTLACTIGAVVGFGHFFAPYVFKWYSYIPGAPLEIIQSINYVNFCFSFLLTGISIVLLIVQRQLFSGSKELRMFYVFFVAIWVARVAIQLLWPWPSGLQTWLLVAFTTELLLASLPLLQLTARAR